MDITKAQFWNTPNVAGRESFSYAQLLAQIQKDNPPPPPPPASGAINGALVQGGLGQVIPDNVVTAVDYSIGFTTIRYQDGGTWFNPVNGTLLVIPPALLTPTSRVQVFGYVEWPINTVGHRLMIETAQPIGAIQQTVLPVAGVNTRQSGTSAMRETLGFLGTYSLQVLQTSGGPLALQGATFGVRIVQS